MANILRCCVIHELRLQSVFMAAMLEDKFQVPKFKYKNKRLFENICPSTRHNTWKHPMLPGGLFRLKLMVDLAKRAHPKETNSSPMWRQSYVSYYKPPIQDNLSIFIFFLALLFLQQYYWIVAYFKVALRFFHHPHFFSFTALSFRNCFCFIF